MARGTTPRGVYWSVMGMVGESWTGWGYDDSYNAWGKDEKNKERLWPYNESVVQSTKSVVQSS